jgi:ribosomal protein S18 acetylase RimI-like enzyme
MVIPPGGPTVEELEAARVVLVAGRPPVGFAQVDELGGLAHLAELDVAPGRMRQGIGSALLESACVWAREHGYRAITLTTFADVPWNAPFYAARGFVEVDELSPELAEVRDWERARGLDALGRRIAMCRALSSDDQARRPPVGGLRA